jgi:alkylation response protein AidB-like acyl-CoA dehydrogenase
MDFRLDAEQEKWREEVRDFLRENMTGAFRQELTDGGPELVKITVTDDEVSRAVIERGWYGLNWPKEYGGLAKSATEQLILMDEFQRAGAPGMPLTVTSLGPTIIRFGTDENKQEWLPKIITGQVYFALGYSEPDSGSDLASLQTRAVLDGDEWVINGQKIWNSEAHVATHEWLAVRTDPAAPKHKGISVIITPIDQPGISVSPIWTWGDVRTNQIFFTDVRAPRKNLIGELNRGWYYIASALDFERVAIGVYAGVRRLVDHVTELAKHTVIDGKVLAHRPEVRAGLAQLERDVEVGRLMNYRTAAMIDAGKVPNMEASAQKVYISELAYRASTFGTQIFSLAGQLNAADPNAPLAGAIEMAYRVSPVGRFAGGTNEIQRNIIAQRGLGLPRA